MFCENKFKALRLIHLSHFSFRICISSPQTGGFSGQRLFLSISVAHFQIHSAPSTNSDLHRCLFSEDLFILYRMEQRTCLQ